MGNFVCLHVLFDPPAKLDYFVPVFLPLYFDFSSNFQGLVGLTKDQVFEFVYVELLHVNFLLSGAFRMVELVTLLIIALDARSSLYRVTNQTFFLEPFLVYVLHSLYIDLTIFLLKVTLRDPYCAHIVHPYIVTDWFICWVG